MLMFQDGGTWERVSSNVLSEYILNILEAVGTGLFWLTKVYCITPIIKPGEQVPRKRWWPQQLHAWLQVVLF